MTRMTAPVNVVDIDAFLSFTIALVLLVLGKIVTMLIEPLRRYSIHEAVIGGLLCAALVALAYFGFGQQIRFELTARDFLLLMFFAGIGLKSDIRSLLQGGRPLIMLLALASVFILLQNGMAMAMAKAFGLDPRAGLMVGSISLTGGVGTTLAWAPHFERDFGIGNAMELGLAGNTLGLIAACVIGGPMAAWLMRRHAVEPSTDTRLDIGTTHDEDDAPLDYFGILWALLILNTTIMLGIGLHGMIDTLGLKLPTFVGCLFAGILVRNVLPHIVGRTLLRLWPGIRHGFALISDLSLGLFLIMALMGLQLWQLAGSFGFIITVLTLQIALTIGYTLLLVFRLMGRDYEAVVMAAGFGGITLGSTATAIANMTAVTQQYGAAHRAFVILPLVCGFFIDIVNALVIALLIR
ncbi:sodium/glutamate symporter [Ferrovibrio sp.]|uniref:sodium/glutamate symporter n=1 Tax=Ferrovibrio sp. TaxID=1917215 RepID=UPI0025BF8B27|nr:sodium/glutamate symporter [Ferrovibrio sp.]